MSVSDFKYCIQKVNVCFFVYSDITLMQEELGDLIYSVIEKGMAQETACQVTGMLLEMDIVSLHEVLADDFLFKKRLKQALRACKLMKT